ncbi:hypothetical protein TKK_0011120 [Trichogramma kaykai]|uniref:folate gamma-glutamyl hydrolase n=1 Tax=Trichogramma kaykai TaxID=54128 RepID=A0ABD2WTY8_9HYME
MRPALVFLAVCLSCLADPALLVAATKHGAKLNSRPVIGILTQEISYQLKELYPGPYNAYLAASYVKFIEGAGARVAPIWLGQTEAYYEDILGKVNGVLLPGGAAWFNVTNGYAESAEKIYNIATRLNTNGDYFPIWGTCLGFEVLLYIASNRKDYRFDCSSKNRAVPLELTNDYRKSRLFRNASENLVNVLETENVTWNYHRFCFNKQSLREAQISEDYRVMSYNRDESNKKFISTLEHVTHPFYGVQFHPEKNAYEWRPGKNVPHTQNAIQVSQYFANFFVNEARKNQHSFHNKSEENAALIYNYPATFTGQKGASYDVCYLFEKR